MSLRARLLAGMVALVAAGLVAAAFATYEEQRSFLLTRVDQQVLSAVVPISAQLRVDRFGPPGSLHGRRPLRELFGDKFPPRRALNILPPGTFGELRDSSGTVLRRRTFSYGGAAGPSPSVPASVPISSQFGNPHLFTVQSQGPDGTRYRASRI